MALLISAVVAQGAFGRPTAPSPLPSFLGPPSPRPTGSASAAPLPTATPEPPGVAIPRLEAILKANPNDKTALQELAGYYLGVNRPDQALAMTQRLIALGVRNAQVLYLDGVASQSVGRLKEATEDLENASNQEPTNAQILLTLTRLYLQTNRGGDAERVAKRATTFNPNDPTVFENYGFVLATEKKYDEARQQFETAAKVSPKDPEPFILEAKTYEEQNALALAGQLYDRALTVDPKYGEALLGKARLLAVEHNIKDSIATYELLLATLTTDQAKAALLIEEFQVYRSEKMTAEADAAIKRVVAAYPNVAAVHVAYGDYYASNKDLTNATNEWKTALGPNRDNPDALERLGQLAASQNKPNEAIDDFKRVTEVTPNDPTAFLQLGQMYGLLRQYDKARENYRHSFELSKTPQALAGYGTSDFEENNFKECAAVFDAVDRGAGDYLKQNPQLYYVMGKCYQQTGQRDKARLAYTRFQAFVKPGSQLAQQVKKAIDSLNHTDPPRPAPKPALKATPKPSVKVTPKPSASPH